MSLRGLVLDSLREGDYRVVLDHLQETAAGLAADVREIIFRGDTPVTGVARSAHMEDLGFLTSCFMLRSDQMSIRPFAPDWLANSPSKRGSNETVRGKPQPLSGAGCGTQRWAAREHGYAHQDGAAAAL